MYSSDDVEKKCVESRWGEGRNGGALVRKGPRLERTAFSFVSALLREDETMSFRELGGACLDALLARQTTIPAARRVTHSKVSFRSPISSTELCPAGSSTKAVVEPAVVWPEDTASRRVDSGDLPQHESACSSR